MFDRAREHDRLHFIELIARVQATSLWLFILVIAKIVDSSFTYFVRFRTNKCAEKIHSIALFLLACNLQR